MKNEAKFNEILNYLSSSEEQKEHKRLWDSIADTWNDTYLSTYLIYLSTYVRLQQLLKSNSFDNDANQNPWYIESKKAIIIKQHMQACKEMGLTPKSKQANGTAGRRRSGEDADPFSRNSLFE